MAEARPGRQGGFLQEDPTWAQGILDSPSAFEDLFEQRVAKLPWPLPSENKILAPVSSVHQRQNQRNPIPFQQRHERGNLNTDTSR